MATELANIHSTVLGWYAANGRGLAFRNTADPWAILVSEVMAQQTQAARAAVAWSSFVGRFPTPASLAAASPADVIRAWRGLGYNRRAVALRAAAIDIVSKHGGRVPDSFEALLALSGIGPYSARAVLAIAFGQPVAALDVNIARVLRRASIPPTTPTQTSAEFQAAADRLVPRDDAARWTHALMDIGARFCRPRGPHCSDCPLARTCAHARDVGAGTTTAAAREAPRRAAPPFPATRRWLRGRILDRLRDAPSGEWVAFDEPLGVHDQAAVEVSVCRLAAEGLVELVDGRARLSP